MKGSYLLEKASVDTVVPCAVGKMRNWDTVVGSVQSHEKDRRKHWLLLRQK